MDESGLHKIIEPYVYGMVIPERLEALILDQKLNRLVVPGFFRRGEYLPRGLCGELALIAERDIGGHYQDHCVLRALGTDNRYFNHPRSEHAFLLVFDDNPLGERPKLDGPELEELLRQNPLLVDPSFKLVMPYRVSGYNAKVVVNEPPRPKGRGIL